MRRDLQELRHRAGVDNQKHDTFVLTIPKNALEREELETIAEFVIKKANLQTGGARTDSSSAFIRVPIIEKEKNPFLSRGYYEFKDLYDWLYHQVQQDSRPVLPHTVTGGAPEEKKHARECRPDQIFSLFEYDSNYHEQIEKWLSQLEFIREESGQKKKITLTEWMQKYYGLKPKQFHRLIALAKRKFIIPSQLNFLKPVFFILLPLLIFYARQRRPFTDYDNQEAVLIFEKIRTTFNPIDIPTDKGMMLGWYSSACSKNMPYAGFEFGTFSIRELSIKIALRNLGREFFRRKNIKILSILQFYHFEVKTSFLYVFANRFIPVLTAMAGVFACLTKDRDSVPGRQIAILCLLQMVSWLARFALMDFMWLKPQYVALAAGCNFFNFTLPGTNTPLVNIDSFEPEPLNLEAEDGYFLWFLTVALNFFAMFVVEPTLSKKCLSSTYRCLNWLRGTTDSTDSINLTNYDSVEPEIETKSLAPRGPSN